MYKNLTILILCFNAGFLHAQTNKTLMFHPVFGHSALELNGFFYKLPHGDSILIETVKFYISEIELLNSNGTVWKEQNSFHLLDASAISSLQILLSTPPNLHFDQIRFHIGIDSTTNVSGAMGGDLDPTRGMYWTWQNGYINFKLEGKSNLCKTRKNEFQFHLGGYQYPFNTIQTAILNLPENKEINISVNIEKLFGNIDLSKQNHIMSPGKEAVVLSEKVLSIFSTALQ